ncbi:MAG: VOC family protein, partial [Chloroflexi bacterium]|nr:VOC family protein [Chloroflexota bacterium]
MRLAKVTLVVRDYDETIAWFRDRLGFVVREDTPVPEQGKR